MHEIAGNVIRFSNNTAGMEKILKAMIGLLIIPTTKTFRKITPVSHRLRCKFEYAEKELLIARKIVKFLYVLDAGLKAFEARKSPKGGVLKWLIVGKWACAFVYAASEAVTILHHMRVLNAAKSWWAKSANHKGAKFYFVSILFSIMASAYQLWEITTAEHQLRKEKRRIKAHKHAHAMAVGTATAYAVHHTSSSSSSSDYDSSSSSSSSSDDNHRRWKREQEAARRRALHQDDHAYPVAASPIESISSAASPTLNPTILNAEAKLANAAEWERKKLYVDAAKTKQTVLSTGSVVTQLMADCCDLAIPAHKVGWYENKEAVGAAYLISSVLAGSVIWGRVNASHNEEHRRKSHTIQMVKKETYNINVDEEDRRTGGASTSSSKWDRTKSETRLDTSVHTERINTSSNVYNTSAHRTHSASGRVQGTSSSSNLGTTLLVGAAGVAAGAAVANAVNSKKKTGYGGWSYDASQQDGLHTTDWNRTHGHSGGHASSSHSTTQFDVQTTQINGQPIQIVQNDVYDVTVSGSSKTGSKIKDLSSRFGKKSSDSNSIQVVKAEVYNSGALEGRTGEIIQDLGIVKIGPDGKPIVEDPQAMINMIKNAKQASDADVAAGGSGQMQFTNSSTSVEGGVTKYTTTTVHRFEETSSSSQQKQQQSSSSYSTSGEVKTQGEAASYYNNTV
ncbi:hypothetical protein TWF694_003441 [Orbilia ellipsospora]|uniref:Uncharacterized protein n=1 Tax=Orbilia ellipsospora TaxID=2528407 RepID=A0AAV9WY71_9PEZI